jgi:copper resistance protein C
MPSHLRHKIALASVAILSASQAVAHPKLIVSTPAPNSTVAAPSSVALTFNEALLPQLSGVEIALTAKSANSGRLTPISGTRVALEADQKTLTVTITDPLRTGDYEVLWHVVSVDTHRIQGTFSFSVK